MNEAAIYPLLVSHSAAVLSLDDVSGDSQLNVADALRTQSQALMRGPCRLWGVSNGCPGHANASRKALGLAEGNFYER